MLTIAIPFFNAHKYLPNAIDSVLAQTHEQWDLLLIDDGSHDSSLEIANQYAQMDDRITVVSDGKNQGLAYRLNQSIQLANGEYYARMDADDIMHPKRLEKQLQILKDNPNIDVLGTNAYVIDENDLVFGMRYRENSGLTKVEHFIHPTIMAKKQWFIDNPYDEKATRIEDVELWYRSKKSSNFMITNEPLLFYREFGGSYYKKYLASNDSKDYILIKYKSNSYWKWKKFFLKNKIMGNLYWIANKFDKENILINKRNEVIFDSKKPLEIYINKF